MSPTPPPPYGRALSHPYSKERPRLERTSPPSSDDSPSNNNPINILPDLSNLDNSFEVAIKRNSLGLGFSICGGPEAPAPWTNLIRVKKVFPLQPAWETGSIKVGDVILKVCGIPLYSLTIRQALDILRSSPPNTVLQMCRIPDTNYSSSPPKSRQVVRSYSYGPAGLPSPSSWGSSGAANFSLAVPRKKNSEPAYGSGLPSFEAVLGGRDDAMMLTDNSNLGCQIPASSLSRTDLGSENDIEMAEEMEEREWSPQSDSANKDGDTLELLKPVEIALKNSNKTSVVGEFSIVLKKVNGSLGFTLLTSSDDTVLKHTVKGLVKEPAVSDGRIQPGDKLLTANNVDLTTFSHQELIAFLRQCPEEVRLGLYRDASRSQTPLTPDTNISSHHNQNEESSGSSNNLSGSASFSNMASLLARKSQSPSRKHLRYEARELVRSLQSSRTSLEKAGLSNSKPGSYCSGGTLGRRLGRPFSPASANRERTSSANRERASSANRDKNLNLGVKVNVDKSGLLVPGSPVPRIESPVTPCSLGEQVSQVLNNLQLEERLQIEEVPDDDSKDCPDTTTSFYSMDGFQQGSSTSLVGMVQSPGSSSSLVGMVQSPGTPGSSSSWIQAAAHGQAGSPSLVTPETSQNAAYFQDFRNNNGSPPEFDNQTKPGLMQTKSLPNGGSEGSTCPATSTASRPNRLDLFEAETLRRRGYLFNSQSTIDKEDNENI